MYWVTLESIYFGESVSRKYCELKICDTQLLCLGGNSVVLNIFECFILPFFSKIGELKTATRFRDII